MNKSIRSKLFISTSLLIIFFIVFLWILNNLYLEQYYMKKKENKLVENVKKINSIYKGNVDEISDELDKTANVTGSNIEIKDSNGKLKYSSDRRFPKEMDVIKPFLPPHNAPPRDKHPSMDEISQYTEGGYTFETQRDKKMKIDFLALTTKLNNGDNIVVRVPIVSIKESADIANNFVIITGLGIIILGGIWAFIFSKRFTKPILELNKAAKNMAKFNFNIKCNISGDDEVGQLGKNINYLSSELSRAITELNIKNQKLEEDINRERKIDEMRKEFISNVSHELRTPISIIQSYAEGLVSNVAESEEDKNFYCNVIINEVEKMNKLVKDLLDLSQIESGYLHLEKKEFDVTALIEYVLNKYRSLLLEKNINLEYEECEHIAGYGDMIRIEQVLTNFINNAVNHIEGERIIKVWAKIIDNKIRVGVYNTGKHISEEAMEKIWTSFYKVDKARTRAYGGYGLGLSIVRAIQEIQNNEYGVENVEGGVTFWFDIDRA